MNYDGQKVMSKETFISILKKTIPENNSLLFSIFGSKPCIHFVLFVHRVDDLLPGVYFLFRAEENTFQTKTRNEFLWEKVESDIPLYLLSKGNAEDLAIGVSCQQDIAGDSCFSLGMIAEFKQNVEKNAFLYKYLLC